MKRKLVTVLMALLLCCPVGTTYAFSWAPVINAIASLAGGPLQGLLNEAHFMNISKLGVVGQLGSVIGEVAGTRNTVNDVFKAVLSVATGSGGNDIFRGLLTQSMEGTGIFGDLYKGQNVTGLNINDYINQKILGTINDKTINALGKDGGFLFSMNNGKIDVGIAVGGPSITSNGKGAFERQLDSIGTVDIGGIQAKFMSAEKARVTLLSQQMNAAMERNKKLVEANSKCMENISKYMKQLDDNSKKVSEFQAALDAFQVTDSFGEAGRQALLQRMQKETLTEADIERLHTMISAERAKMDMNNSIMETNKQNLQIMQSAAKMQSEVDRELLARKEAEMAGVQSQSFILALPATPVYTKNSRHEAISKIFDD